MMKVLLAGIALFLVGECANMADASSIGIVLIVISIGWGVVKLFSGSGGCSGGVYDDYYRSYSDDGRRYSDDYIEAVRRNDPRFHV